MSSKKNESPIKGVSQMIMNGESMMSHLKRASNSRENSMENTLKRTVKGDEIQSP